MKIIRDYCDYKDIEEMDFHGGKELDSTMNSLDVLRTWDHL